MRRNAALWMVFATLLACGSEYREDPSVVKRLRILSIAAEPPGVNPGDTTTLSALVADPYGNGRALHYLWAICPSAAAASSGLPVGEAACADPTSRVVIGSGATLAWTVPATVLAALSPSQQVSGIDLPLVLEVTAEGARHDAVKRVHISTATSFDHNPVVTALRFDGIDPGAAAASFAWGGTVDLSALVTDPDASDSPLVELYATTGHMEFNTTSPGGSVFWQLTGTKPADAWVYAVTRDGAGGNAWTARHVIFP